MQIKTKLRSPLMTLVVAFYKNRGRSKNMNSPKHLAWFSPSHMLGHISLSIKINARPWFRIKFDIVQEEEQGKPNAILQWISFLCFLKKWIPYKNPVKGEGTHAKIPIYSFFYTRLYRSFHRPHPSIIILTQRESFCVFFVSWSLI